MTAPAPVAAESPLSDAVVAELSALLDGPHAAVRQHTREVLCSLGLDAADGLDREAYRDRVLEWCRQVARPAPARARFRATSGARTTRAAASPASRPSATATCRCWSRSGVQFGLFGGAVHRLGTERHHERYLRDAARSTCRAASP
jgi:acyl-CoA oxidase